MSTITKQSQEIARKRAAWNRTGGGVLLTAELTGKDAGGVHWRVLVDGGNRYGGRVHWIAGRASGGGYDVRGAAMAEAVRGVCRVGADVVDMGASVHTWRERLAPLGWSLLCWGNDCEALALVPSEAVAAEILKQANA